MTWRSYTDAEKAEAVGLALAIGPKRAAVQLGYPRRTISSWMTAPSSGVQAAIVRSRDDVATRLWEAVTAGTDAVLAGLRDPKARLSDKASALRIVVEAHALITGQATARTETTVTTGTAGGQWEDPEQARRAFEELDRLTTMTDDELQTWLLQDGGLKDIQAVQRRMQQAEAGGPPDVE